MLQDYVSSGDFTMSAKIKRAIRSNLIFYAVMGVLGILFIFYLVVSEKLQQ